jgi:iron complex outermembrane recepter protein
MFNLNHVFMRKLMTLLLLLATTWAYAQVNGKVVDVNTNEPIVGASVIEKGTVRGTITDFDGNFTVDSEDGAHI